MVHSLIPAPRRLESRAGVFRAQGQLRIAAPTSWHPFIAPFQSCALKVTGHTPLLLAPDGAATIHLHLDESFGREQFSFDINDDIDIRAGGPSGAFYALGALRQLAGNSWWSEEALENDESLTLPRVSVDDHPDYAWRGVHLDVARHFFDVATVCRFIELAADHRLNRIHLHLNDDQGWRVEIPGWPRLTEVASQRRSSPVGHEMFKVDDGVSHGGYFSAEDLVAIREFARQHCVVVVPEIDLPGHTQAVVAAYPEFGNTGEDLEVMTRWGISEHVLNPLPATLDFAEEVVRYVARLFPHSPIHIGGDECPTTQWESSDDARAVMEQHGFTEARQLQGLFTERLARVLRADGHEVLAWDEVLDAAVPDGTVIVAWRGSQKAIEAAERGYDSIMAPLNYTYFDWLSSDQLGEPVALGGPPLVTPWEKVFRFSPLPPGLDESLHPRIRGAQAQLWTEYIATRDHLDYMAFPRLCVFSEVVWGSPHEFDEFSARLRVHLERLHRRGVRFRPLDSTP